MKGNSALTELVIIVAIIGLIINFIISAVSVLLLPFGITISIVGVLTLSYIVHRHIYFNGNKFLSLKSDIQKYIQNCGELNVHINELKSSFVEINSYDFGKGELNDFSNYKFKRKEWQNNIKNHQTYNCSLAVCKSASNQPIKYLCKYFNIETNESTLTGFETVFNDFAAAEQGKELLRNERDSIFNNISDSIPKFILYFNKGMVVRKLGFETYDFSDLYFPVYTFQYVSAGGNSSTKCDIKLNIDNLEKLIFYLSDLIKFKKSIQGQRALMTSALRERIKSRDNFCCKKCSLSIQDEKNLLLEIDHIIPLSKGGITSEDNLQTLCWRCNRTKGSKI